MLRGHLERSDAELEISRLELRDGALHVHHVARLLHQGLVVCAWYVHGTASPGPGRRGAAVRVKPPWDCKRGADFVKHV